MANETLAIFVKTSTYFYRKCRTDIESYQESLSSRDGDIRTSRFLPRVPLGWLATACSEACLPLHLRVKLSSVPRAFAAPVTVPLSYHRVKLNGPAAKLSWVICYTQSSLFGSVGRLPTITIGHKSLKTAWNLEWNERARIVSFHFNQSNRSHRNTASDAAMRHPFIHVLAQGSAKRASLFANQHILRIPG